VRDEIRLLSVDGADDRGVPDPTDLERADERLVVEEVHSVRAGLDRLAGAGFDCVLSAYELPDSDGVSFLRRVGDRHPDLPFVLCTGAGSEAVASEAIAAGVTDYVVTEPGTDQSEDVAARITGAIGPESGEPETRVRELTEATEDVLWLLSADWEDVLFVNSAYADIWGQSEATLRADPTAFLDAVHPDDRARAREAVDQLSGGESVEIELRVNAGEDYERRVLIQAEPIFGPDGTVDRIAGASRDVTEQRARQRRLEEETQLVESIFSALPDVLYTFDTHGYLLRWNEQLEAATGYSSGEIEEMYVTDFVPAGEVEQIASSFQRIIQDRQSVTVESAFETKDGDRVPFEFTGAPLEDADGDLRGVTGIGRDISDRKERQRRFEAVFDNTYQFTGLMSPDGTLLEVNQAAIRFSGLDRDELVGEQIWDAYWFQTSETAREVARTAVEQAREGEFFREQLTVQGSDREAVIDFSVRPVTDENGDVVLLIPEGRDITRLTRREQQLRVTNRFLRHNIRNKLTAIKGNAALLSDVGANDRLQSIGESIAAAADDLDETAEMARAVHELIERDPEQAPVDVVDRLDGAIQAVQESHPQAEITVDAPESLAVNCLRSLDEAIAELLRVVLEHATTGRATVTVDVETAETAVVAVRTADGGLPTAEQEVLTGDIDVEPVRHAQGLGVWYVYWQIQYSGGAIDVSDGGRDVLLRLPRS
jgi:PAS domain S-box-containing protein